MDQRDAVLKYLSTEAHRRAAERGEVVPTGWRELSHLPMGLDETGAIPWFDGSRMRRDQVEDTIDSLERFIGVKERQEVARDSVLAYFEAFTSGRQSDIEEWTRLSNRTVRRELAALEADARIVVKQEPNPRRNGATPRKRYHLADNRTEYREVRVGDTDLFSDTDGDGRSDTGIRHHGTGVQGVTCGCSRCGEAFEIALVAELRSKARQAGDRKAAFAAGLEARAMRREAGRT